MGPLIRILLRYGVGAVIGFEIGTQLASDPDVLAATSVIATAAIGLITEGFYILAKRLGWRT
mgnify:CR=1 FL=1